MTPSSALRNHVTGAIARGEAEAITEIAPPVMRFYFLIESTTYYAHARNSSDAAQKVIRHVGGHGFAVGLLRSWSERTSSRPDPKSVCCN